MIYYQARGTAAVTNARPMTAEMPAPTCATWRAKLGTAYNMYNMFSLFGRSEH